MHPDLSRTWYGNARYKVEQRRFPRSAEPCEHGGTPNGEHQLRNVEYLKDAAIAKWERFL